ncbi:unnamed protein product [Ilex paraguariensis]|uniref:histidine kinase n=1 Tax=Ilex paraguariensis TaxID=185542 RepID=A0ABC8QS23_9AQUA
MLQSNEIRNKTFSQVETTARLLPPFNLSASNLARALSSSLNGTDLSFPAIQTKVAPALFLAFSTIPLVSQVSYVGLDGLVFSFYNDEDQTLAVFSNTSFSSTWYTQPVNRDTGKLYGQAISLNSMITANTSWFEKALNSTLAYSSLETGWNKAQDLLILNSVAIYGRGVIAIGFPAQMIINHFLGIDFHSGDFSLATDNGQVLVQTNLPGTQIVVYNGTVSVQLIKLTGDRENVSGNHSCRANDGKPGYFHMNIMGMKHICYCSTLEFAGVQSVYMLAFPTNGLEGMVQGNSNLVLAFLVVMFVIIVASLCIFLILILRAARREMFLCSALIKQKDSTQQAERKSMNKSLAFASASHDVRASLAAIIGLIELCHEDAPPKSELAANLVQINTCTRDLLGILNSVLDTTKIEAGKMQLEEEEFNLAQVLEDVVDMYYPIGMKKGIDVVLDPCDGSILKIHHVKGDRGKLKQILCNLLSNSVKFTSEGHISVRAIVKKTSKEKAIIASNRNGLLNCLSRLCYKNNGSFNALDDLHTVQQNPNSMEFVFEVDDTGKGISKDKQKSVFENFVQVKETALGQGGCGLGLGIVQSLVRLMGGEIKIVDKEHGERGTCFRFNIFLATREPECTDIEEHGNYMLNNSPSSDIHQHFGRLVRSPAPRSEGSQVILLLAGEERRRISKKWIENLGIKVSAVKQGKELFHVLEKIKQKLDLCQFSSSDKSASNDSNSGANDGASATKDGCDHAVPHCKKSNSRSSSNFILIVIDAGAGPFSELCPLVSNFRKDIQNSLCKVVWLDNRVMRHTNSEQEENRPTLPCDHILSKPFHGSRLYHVLGLLPEFGGAHQYKMISEAAQVVQYSIGPNASNEFTTTGVHLGTSSPPQLQKIVIHECHEESSEKPLSGKKVLVVEDNPVLSMVAVATLCKNGATVEVCENGQEAFDQVCKALRDQSKEGHSMTLPYDIILMDCEMTVMSGFEATKLIRAEEKVYGVHIPIIALTANPLTEESSKTIDDVGMDSHLTKPLLIGQLLNVIKLMECK